MLITRSTDEVAYHLGPLEEVQMWRHPTLGDTCNLKGSYAESPIVVASGPVPSKTGCDLTLCSDSGNHRHWWRSCRSKLLRVSTHSFRWAPEALRRVSALSKRTANHRKSTENHRKIHRMRRPEKETELTQWQHNSPTERSQSTAQRRTAGQYQSDSTAFRHAQRDDARTVEIRKQRGISEC